MQAVFFSKLGERISSGVPSLLRSLRSNLEFSLEYSGEPLKVSIVDRYGCCQSKEMLLEATLSGALFSLSELLLLFEHPMSVKEIMVAEAKETKEKFFTENPPDKTFFVINFITIVNISQLRYYYKSKIPIENVADDIEESIDISLTTW